MSARLRLSKVAAARRAEAARRPLELRPGTSDVLECVVCGRARCVLVVIGTGRCLDCADVANP